MNFSVLLFKTIAKLLRYKNLYLVNSLEYKNKAPLLLEPSIDYVRYATLELCRNEIVFHKLKGNIAELGVYQGNFAKRLNILFPDKKLYLFDTFEGFNNKDIEKEISKNYSDGSQDFSNTSVQAVLNKMKYPQNCIIKKGYFPDTAKDVEDTFSFVSIDTDLYEPILNGLIFFYLRLERKGYIFIHDFNNSAYKGAREAVLDFCKEANINYTPIPDSGGSVIITK